MPRSEDFAKSDRGTKYDQATRERILALLGECDLPRDALPYTEQFDALKGEFERWRNAPIEDVRFWRMLSSIGKGGGPGGKSGKKKRAPRTPTLTAEEQFEILRLMPDGVGNRDHLPYTARFDDLHQRFTKLTGRELTRHEFWRGLSRVAKLARKPKAAFRSRDAGVLDQQIVEILERLNPWWRGGAGQVAESYRRWAFNEVVDRLRSKIAKIVVLRGSRRVGKSVIQTQLIEDLLLLGRFDTTLRPVDPSRILLVQFDEIPSLGGLLNPIESIVRWYEENVLKMTMNTAARGGTPAYLFFDEVQNLYKWSGQLKILADHTDANFIVTGSSAMRITAGQDNLAGRITPIELGPLRLSEIAGIRRLGNLPPYRPDARMEDWRKREFWLGLVEHGKQHAEIRDEAFRHFSRFGGYPYCHAGPKNGVESLRQQIVQQVITKTIEHDPGHRPRQPQLEPAFVRDVFRICCRYAGQAVMPKRFAVEIQAVSGAPVAHAKVTEALEFLSDSLLLYRIPSVEMLARKQARPPKLCICDHFVRDGVLQGTIPLDPAEPAGCDEAVDTQAGHVIESVIGYFLRGIPGVELSWVPERKDQREIDLLLTIGIGRIPVELKYRSRPPGPTDVKPIEQFCTKPAFSGEFGLVITRSAAGPIGERAIAIPASTFLLLR
ncbi:MAG: ATP-binding protein [Phycisphaerales bacterium]|nr:MAG: ATP-binding protein [Phycisphaerales bacterium]